MMMRHTNHLSPTDPNSGLGWGKALDTAIGDDTEEQKKTAEK